MGTPTLIKNYDVGGTIAAHTIVKFGAADGAVIAATSASDLLVGVSDTIDKVTGERGDVVRHGLADVVAGGTVVRGTKLTADAAGKAVAAAPAAGVNVQVIGVAESSGVAGDVISILISPSVMQG